MQAKNQAIVFSKRRLEALPAPSAGRIFYRDAKTAGLTLCVRPSGDRTFYFYKWAKGRPMQIPLGKFPEMSVENARTATAKMVGQLAAGIDIAVARQAERHEQTVAGLFNYWLDNHAKLHKKTWSEDERQYNTMMKHWASRKLSSIKKSDVQALHTKIGEKHGHYAANRLLALVRAMFNKASDMGFRGENPAKGVKKFREVKRDRFLGREELPAFFRSLLAEPNETLRDFFLVCLLTGARRANVQTMRWEEIDLQGGYWRIPDTKSGEPVVVPLSNPALAILHTRHSAANGSPWVFTSYGRTGHLVAPKAAWKRILDRAGLKDVRIHDLRRSLGSWQAMGGSSLPIIGKSLGHKQASTTMIYARLQVDSVRDSVAAAGQGMLNAGGVTIDVGNVKLLTAK